jgi:tetratricopeptide (TPR) repeat protein
LSAFANFLAEKNISGECDEYYRRAGEIYKPLVAKHPKNSDLMIAYGGFCCNFANLQQARGDNRTAHDWFERAINHLQPLVDHEPRWKDARTYLSNSYLGRSMTHRLLDRPQESLADLDRCEKWDGSTAKKHIVLRYRAATFVVTGEHEKAGQLADELAALQPPSVENLLAASRTWALLAAKNDVAAAQKAVDVLHRLLRITPKTSHDFLSHSDFDAVRDRADFRALLSNES